jgi:hypothetical protein
MASRNLMENGLLSTSNPLEKWNDVILNVLMQMAMKEARKGEEERKGREKKERNKPTENIIPYKLFFFFRVVGDTRV